MTHPRRHSYFTKVGDKAPRESSDDPIAGSDDNSDSEEEENVKKTFTFANRKGKFTESNSIHKKYAQRPRALSLGQNFKVLHR